MSPEVIRAIQMVIAGWRREAEGSRRSQQDYQRLADEHGRDADRAEVAAANLEDALREEGIEA